MARLAALVGVADEVRNEFDWPAVESSLGLRLPEDYKRLVDTFPDGVFRGLVRLNRPGDHRESVKEFLGFYAWQLHDMRELRGDGHDFPYPIFPEPGGLLPWATGSRAEPLFWLTRGEDPNAWPVVTVDPDFSDWQEFAGTTCELLIEVVEGRFDGSRFGVDLAARGPSFRLMEEAAPAPAGRDPRRSFRSHGRTVNEFSLLADMIGPSPVTPPVVDWAGIKRFMGVPLPSDYRSFIDTYGPGTFGDIRIAVPGGPAGFDLYQLLRHAIELAPDWGTRDVTPICPEPDGIIAWGGTADNWMFSWAPLFPNPNQWTMFVYTRGYLEHIDDTSFSQFLRKYAEGSPDVTHILDRNPALLGPVAFTPAPTSYPGTK